MRNSTDDIDKLITNLDITPSMYLIARSRYQTVANELSRQGIDADFYPQGSFRLGTVVRPFVKGEDKQYDLDVIGESTQSKKDIDPDILKYSFGEALRKAPSLSPFLLPEDNRCWTLNYKDYDFQLDIVPSVRETYEYIDSLFKKGVPIEFAQNAIAITHKYSPELYKWDESNPHGYAAWFDGINEPYLQITREKHRMQVLKENRAIFASVEEIPPILDRSALQRVIQILKRHRDVFFANASIANERIWDMRPISAIITTLCARIAQSCIPTANILELLQLIAGELRAHSFLQNENDSILFESKRTRTFIRKFSGKWSIKNPVNPDDDYTDLWTTEHAKWFFKWLDAVNEDFFIDLNTEEKRHFSALKKSFGAKYVENIIPESKQTTPIIITAGTKPYGIGK